MLWLALAAHAADLDSALALRDGFSCSQLGTPDTALRDALIARAEPQAMPPWAPMRAAGCLIELFPTDPVTATTVLPWMTDPERGGLALVVAENIDRFPLEISVQLANAAMAAPASTSRDRLRRRLSTSARPEVLAVLPVTP